MARCNIMHVLTISCIMLLLGCNGCHKTKTTPKGPIGYFDLRPYLPADVAARAPADKVAQEYTQQINIGHCGLQPKIIAHWRTFKDGQNTYLLSASFEVLEAAQGVEISVGIAYAFAVKIHIDEQGSKTSTGNVPLVKFNKASGGDLPGNQGSGDATVETFEFKIDVDQLDGLSRHFCSVAATIHATGELTSN